MWWERAEHLRSPPCRSAPPTYNGRAVHHGCTAGTGWAAAAWSRLEVTPPSRPPRTTALVPRPVRPGPSGPARLCPARPGLGARARGRVRRRRRRGTSVAPGPRGGGTGLPPGGAAPLLQERRLQVRLGPGPGRPRLVPRTSEVAPQVDSARGVAIVCPTPSNGSGGRQ